MFLPPLLWFDGLAQLPETAVFDNEYWAEILTVKTEVNKALEAARKDKKVGGMHWGTAILSLEPIWEPPVRFKANAEKFGYKKEDAIIFKIGEIKKLDQLIN